MLARYMMFQRVGPRVPALFLFRPRLSHGSVQAAICRVAQRRFQASLFLLTRLKAVRKNHPKLMYRTVPFKPVWLFNVR
jgi:hypothetical protein